MAFWLYPDWGDGSNLADPGVQPFWMRPPKAPETKPAGQVMSGAQLRNLAGSNTSYLQNIYMSHLQNLQSQSNNLYGQGLQNGLINRLF